MMVWAAGVTCLAYLLGLFFRLFEKAFGKPMTWHGLLALGFGLFCHVISLLLTFQQAHAGGFFPRPLVLSAAAAALVTLCLGVELRLKDTFYSLLCLPLAIPLTGFSVFLGATLEGPLYQGLWFYAHILLSVSGECCFFLAGFSGLMYLFVLNRLKQKNQLRAVRFFPPLTRLETLISVFAALGFALFSFGLTAGGIWSVQTVGHLRLFDTKRLLSLGVWCFFGLMVGGRTFLNWNGARTAVLAIVGFAASIVLIVLGGTHAHWGP
jgi:ABC-type uncharacterized transport system permease subunit